MSTDNSRPLRIFLSHTEEFSIYPENDSYVSCAKKAVEFAGHACIEMASFPASSSLPTDYDVKKVRECDVYIAIVGNRYGTLTSEGISHTEHEYISAKRAGKTMFVFLMDENSANLRMPPVATNPDRHGDKQELFKEKLKRDLLCKQFSSPDDLYVKIFDALRCHNSAA